VSIKAATESELLAAIPGDQATAGGVLSGLLARYDEPHRKYHDGRHVRWVAARARSLVTTMPVEDPDTVMWAALWHDAIYDPHSSTNEEDSATLAVEELRALGVSEARTAEVARLILLTKGHNVSDDDYDGAALVDADLAVLGGTPDQYAAYVDGVRFEYAFVSDESWRVGRANVLRSILSLPRLFHSPSMVDAEVRARINMRAELASLAE
jgi:predicted metal-dependent HD superfamily phosphohydrolase